MTHRPPTDERVREPERLSDGKSGDAALDELGRWFGAVPPPEGLDEPGVLRVQRRLGGPAPSGLRGWRGPLFGFALVAVTGGAAGMWGLPSLMKRETAPAPATSSDAPESRRVPAPKSALHAPAPRPALSEASPPSAVIEPTPLRLPSAPRSVPTAPASADELSLESAALERALTALKRDHDPARALTLLERYAADFPAGELRLEADVARVDANLALGRRAAALAILDRLPLERVGRGLELGVVRGELYAERDCTRALRDFERVLAANPPPALAERALRGRAVCRAGTSAP